MKSDKLKITISKGDIFDFPADVLFIGSNLYGACESPGAVLSQVMSHGGSSFTMRVRGMLKEINGNIEHSTSVFHIPAEGGLLEKGFKGVALGFPPTGSVDGFVETLQNLRISYGFTQKPLTITMPLVATNVGGISIADWVTSIRKIFSDEAWNSDVPWWKTLNVVTRSDISVVDWELLKTLEG